MNFKIIILVLAPLCCLGCGVKAKPLQAPETAIQSYIESYSLPLDSDKNKNTVKKN